MSKTLFVVTLFYEGDGKTFDTAGVYETKEALMEALHEYSKARQEDFLGSGDVVVENDIKNGVYPFRADDRESEQYYSDPPRMIEVWCIAPPGRMAMIQEVTINAPFFG